MREDVRENQQKRMAAILPGLLRDRGWDAQVELHSIFVAWPKVVDETVSAHAEPQKIVKGTLWVEVENSAWLQQFQFQKMALLNSINGFLKELELDGGEIVNVVDGSGTFRKYHDMSDYGVLACDCSDYIVRFG